MLCIFIVDATHIVAIIKTIIVARPCEDTITLTAEWENYPAREGGKTTKGENYSGDLMPLNIFYATTLGVSFSPQATRCTRPHGLQPRRTSTLNSGSSA